MERVGPYTVLGPLGRGGNAVVVRAAAPDGRAVAIKRLTASAPSAAARFAREARLLAALGPGFVPLLDHGAEVGPDGVERPYLVMPLLEGGTLRERLKRLGARPADEVAALGATLADALARAHALGVAHRDLKPANVLLDAEGRPHIADLGLGVDAEEARGDAPRLTATHEASGTPGYSAPEQIESLRLAGPPADVFALGAILYEALSGQAAFDGDSAIERLACAAQGRSTPLPEVQPDAPPWLADLVHACLAVDPAARPTAADLARALRAGPGGVAAGRPRGPVALAAGAVAVAAAAVAVAAGAVVALRAGPRGAATTPLAADAGADGAAATGSRLAPGSGGAAAAAVPSLVVTGRLGAAWLRHARTPTAVAIAAGPDGEEVALVGAGGFLHGWTLPGGEERFAVRVFRDEELRAVLPVAGGDLAALVLGGGDGVALVRPGARRRDDLQGLRARVVAAATAWRSPRAALVDAAGRVLVWDLGGRATGAGVVTVDCTKNPPTALAFLPDDATIAIALSNGEVVPVRLEPMKVLPRLFAVAPPVRALAVSPEGDRVAVSTRDAAGFVVGLGGGQKFSLEGLGAASALAFGPGGMLYGAVDDGSVYTVDLARSKANRSEGAGSRATPGLAVSASGRMVYLSRESAQPRLLGAAADEGHEGVVLALLPLSGGRLASAGADRTVRVWDLAAGRELACGREHAEAVVALAAAPDGGLLSASRDGAVVARAADGRARERWSLGPGVERLAVTADGLGWAGTRAGLVRLAGPAPDDPGGALLELAAAGDRLLAWGRDGRLALLDPGAGGARWRRALPPASAHCALAVVSAARAALADEAGVRLLDLATGEDVWPAPVLLPGPGRVAASPDGRLLAVLQADAVVALSAADGALLSRAVVSGECDAPTAVAFAGDELLVGLARGPIVRLALRPGPRPGGAR